MRILLDVDGVLADFTEGTRREILAVTGEDVPAHRFTDYNLLYAVGIRHREAIRGAWMRQGWCASIPPYEGMKEAVERLRAHHEVFFVTSPFPDAQHWTWERTQWLKEHFGAGDRDIVFTHAKHVVRGDVLVDDKPSNVIEWCNHHPDKWGVLWAQPYNSGAWLPKNGIRSSSTSAITRGFWK